MTGLSVGCICVGPWDDYGHDQAYAETVALVKKMPGLKVVEEENLPETHPVQKTMQGRIAQDGAPLLFATSHGYFDPHMLAVAAKNPALRFAHCGGMWRPPQTGWLEELKPLAVATPGRKRAWSLSITCPAASVCTLSPAALEVHRSAIPRPVPYRALHALVAAAMLAKLTSKNQLTLPKAVMQAVGPAEYFQVEALAGQIVLTPVRIQRADAVRGKLAELALSEADVAEAVAWARGIPAAK